METIYLPSDRYGHIAYKVISTDMRKKVHICISMVNSHKGEIPFEAAKYGCISELPIEYREQKNLKELS